MCVTSTTVIINDMSSNQTSSNPQMISASKPDWSREKIERWWSPGKQLIRSIRQYQYYKKKGGSLAHLLAKIYVIKHRFWSIVSGADIPLNCQLGGGLLLIHPNGVVIHPKAVIGCNCLILQQVTVTSDVKIGGHVDIGAGAKIINEVTISNHARIGANAVVLCDIPEGAVAVGVPARIIHSKQYKNSNNSLKSMEVVKVD